MQNPQYHDLGSYWTTTYIDADGVQYTTTTDPNPIEIDDRYPHNIEADALDVQEAYNTMCNVGLTFEYNYPFHPHFTMNEALSLQPSLQPPLDSSLQQPTLSSSEPTIPDERKPETKLEKSPKILPTSITDPEIPLPEEPTSTKTRVSRKTRLRRRVSARFKCAAEDCPRSFSRLFDAQRHHRETHLDERMWICDDADRAVQKIGMNGCKVEEGGCRKKFKRSSHLRAHLRVAGQYKRAGTFDNPIKALPIDNTYHQAPTVHIHESYPENTPF